MTLKPNISAVLSLARGAPDSLNPQTAPA
jgi:hypothetical protein